MNRVLLTLSVALLAGCDTHIEPAATPTPVPVATPKPVPKAATPKPGEWRMKDYKNPLEKKSGH